MKVEHPKKQKYELTATRVIYRSRSSSSSVDIHLPPACAGTPAGSVPPLDKRSVLSILFDHTRIL